jgi:small subunit ribosomal protein S19e
MAEEARGICVRDVPAPAFIAAYAEHLKNSDKFELPVWADTIKTGVFKELSPYGDDWYYIRAASIARKVYLRPGVGVGMLQKWYGGNYRRGARTEHFRKANSGVIRSVLIQLQEMRVVEAVESGGRRVTTVGQQDLDRIAGSVFRAGEESDSDDDSGSDSDSD